MKVGITGAQGVLGSHLFQALSAAGGIEIIALDEFTRNRRSLAELPPGLNWILHFASRTSIKHSLEDPFQTYQENLSSTGIALEMARRSNSAFLFMSSYVYGSLKSQPASELHPAAAQDPYMGSKLLCEAYCAQYHDLFSVPLIILRGFNIYGGKSIPGRVISDLVANAKAKEPFVLNVGDIVRDYLWIDDFTDLIKKIIATNPTKSGTYNVGSGSGYSNLEVAEIFRSLTGEQRPVQVRGNHRPTDVPAQIADIRKVISTFGWKPQISLREGIKILLTRP